MSHVRSYLTGKDRQAQAKAVHDELALEPVLRTLSVDIIAALEQSMDQSDGLTPDIIAAEFPEFEAFTKGSQI